MHWPTTHSALVDLAGFYRDSPASAWVGRQHAVLACREALELNVKPRIAVEAMTSALQRGEQRPGEPAARDRYTDLAVRQRRLSSVGQSSSLVMSRSGVRFPEAARRSAPVHVDLDGG